jgi:hypothetical protein
MMYAAARANSTNLGNLSVAGAVILAGVDWLSGDTFGE